MARIEKTVFVSYRRADEPWALAVFADLTQHGYDVFIDYDGVASANFEAVILENIRARAHFLVLLTPTALERCRDPNDWMRREIEAALDSQRNIVPLILAGFDFGTPAIATQLAGKLAALKEYNGLEIPKGYFAPAMERLRNKFLSVSLDTVLHPASDSAQVLVTQQKRKAFDLLTTEQPAQPSDPPRISAGPLLELKLLLVGRGAAGKTTLVKRLAGEQPLKNEPETHSIRIREFLLKCARGQVRTRAWDFGGQEILHSTHQFFLTERSLYLLVLEPRTGLAQRDAEYWLKLIEIQGSGSPVIVLMNWSHGGRWRVDEVKLRRKFPFIVDFLSIDAFHGDGIEELERCLAQTVEQRLQDVWLPFPTRWRAIKDHVASMHDNFLTYNRYAKLCIRFGEDEPAAQSELAGILHALGLALYFGKDPRLYDTRVLNPRWVTGGVYAVIRSPSVTAKDGQLAMSDMPRVLREAEEQDLIKASDYPGESGRFILELMRAFQLCYASDEEKAPKLNALKRISEFRGGGDEREMRPVRYLVPELLPEYEPEMKEPWEESPVRLRYRYEVLPPGLLPRFIVRTHAFSDGAPHWRHGVVLRHAEAQALIRAESDQLELHVFVLGGDEDTRRILVTIVRRELESLHAEMRMQPVEELELTGEGKHWIGVKALREVEQPEKPTQKLPIQPDGTAEVNVSRELDKLVPAAARAIDRDPSIAPVPVRVFVSYAHEDERLLKRLDAILDVLEQQHGLASWRDKRLIAGDEWDEEIRSRLEDMDIFVFIASQTSLVRPYIKDPELKRAKERRAGGEIEIVIVKLEPCACDDDAFLGKLQRLAPRLKSIVETSPRSTGWEQVRKDLLPVIQRVREKKRPLARHTLAQPNFLQ
jgi:internalin A